MADTPTDVDKYIAQFTPDVQQRLQQIRAIVQKAAPDANEVISYGMPAYRLPGQKGYPAVFIGAHANHIGIYPGLTQVPETLAEEISKYQTGKGTVQFANNAPLPVAFITAYVRQRFRETRSQA